MKKYQKLFLLSGAVLGLFASHSTVHATETPESEVKILGPTDRASNVDVTVNDRTASISYTRSQAQEPYLIAHAIWSEENGQDDLKWYDTPQTPITDIDLSNHPGYGTFHVHTYIRIGERLVALNATTFHVDKPTSKTNASVSGGTGRISFSRNKDQAHSKIVHAVWSEEKGSDDLQWYDAGEELTEFSLSKHRGYGRYFVDTYENVNGKMIFLSGTTFHLENPKPIIETSFPQTGIMEITVKNVPDTMHQIVLPTWSDKKGQDDIKWYTANKVGNGTYKFTVDTQNHKGSGLFNTHVYRRKAGQLTGLTGTSYQVEKSSVQSANIQPNYAAANATTYPVGQCTWGAKALAPWAGNYWGNGGQWAASARRAGFRTGSTPEVGAIACWDDGGYGHVGVVTHVESNTRIQIQESNYLGKQYISNFRGWFDPTASYWGRLTYIYPK